MTEDRQTKEHFNYGNGVHCRNLKLLKHITSTDLIRRGINPIIGPGRKNSLQAPLAKMSLLALFIKHNLTFYREIVVFLFINGSECRGYYYTKSWLCIESERASQCALHCVFKHMGFYQLRTIGIFKENSYAYCLLTDRLFLE